MNKLMCLQMVNRSKMINLSNWNSWWDDWYRWYTKLWYMQLMIWGFEDEWTDNQTIKFSTRSYKIFRNTYAGTNDVNCCLTNCQCWPLVQHMTVTRPGLVSESFVTLWHHDQDQTPLAGPSLVARQIICGDFSHQ